MTAKDHNKLLSIFFLIQGGLQLIAGIFIALIYGGLGAAFLTTSRRGEEQMMGGIFLVIAVLAGLFVLIFAGLNLLTGWKLMKEQPGARILGIIASCLVLLGFPLGTALGIYGLWFLFGDQGKQFYSGIGNGGLSQTPPPPPPQSWQ